MVAQVIINSDDNVLGYYKDLKEFLKDGVKHFIKDNEFEAAGGMIEELIELEAYKEETKLLIMSENNGMGFTIGVFENA